MASPNSLAARPRVSPTGADYLSGREADSVTLDIRRAPTGLSVARHPPNAAAFMAMQALRRQVGSNSTDTEVNFGRYRWRRVLGRGGGGVVFAAYDPKLDREVAIKLLYEYDDDHHARLQREAQAQARVRHPAVIEVYDVGTYGADTEPVRELLEFFELPSSGSYVVMELVLGRNLGEWLRMETRTQDEILRLICEAGRGLVAIHEAGLIHRDFKPENVMVGDNGKTRVMDLGLARAPTRGRSGDRSETGESPDVDRLTQTGIVTGTPAYMAPEQHDPNGSPGPAADQYGFCVSLWRALWGDFPFKGKNLAELHQRKQEGPVLPRPRPGPRWLERLLLRGLAPHPADRHPSMSAVVTALERRISPVRHRGTWITLLGLVAAGLLVPALVGSTEHCDHTANELVGVWDDARREALDRQLRHRPTRWAIVQGSLDEYASRWITTRTQACRASEESTVPKSSAEATAACLQDRRLRLRGVVEVLSELPRGATDHAQEMIAALPSVEDCRHPGPAPSHSLSPADPKLASVTRHLRELTMKVENLTLAGRYAEAYTLGHQVVQQTQLVAYAPLEIEAKLELGTLLSYMGQPAGAAELLEDAFFHAGRWDIVPEQADAAINLVAVMGDLGNYERALEWGEHAQARVSLIGDEHRQGALLSHLGNVRQLGGEPELAVDLYEQALVAYERADAHAATIGVAQSNLGVAYLGIGDVPAALETLQQARKTLDAALGSTHPTVIDVTANVGMLAIQTGELAEAERQLRRVLRSYEQMPSPNPVAVANVRNNLGVALLEQGRYGDAWAAFDAAREAYAYHMGPEHPRVADALDNLASVHAARGEHRVALAMARRAVTMRETTQSPEHRALANSLMELGRAQLALGNPSEAQPALERGLRLSLDQPGLAEVEAGLRFDLARALDAQGIEPGRATELAQQARAMHTAGGRQPEFEEIDTWLTQRGATAPG